MENKKQSSNHIKAYILFLVVVAIFAFIVAKDVSLPSTVTAPIAAIGLMALFYGSFIKPQFSLLILTAYLPFSKILIGQFGTNITGFNLTNILLIIVMFGWLLNAMGKGEALFCKSSLNPVIVLFCLWGMFAVLRAKFLYGHYYDFEDFFILFKRWITPVFLYFIGLNIVKDKETFKKVVFIIMLVTFIVALMAIRDYIRCGDRGSIDASRIGGVFEQPNTLGAYFVYNMFFFLAFFLYYFKSFKYWLLLVPFLACFRGIMVTFSRGAYIAFGFGGLMTTFFRSKVLFICALVLLMVAISNPVILPGGVRYRLASTFGGDKVIVTNTEEITDPSAAKRILIWKGAIQMIKDRPLFGFGYGMFNYIIGYYTIPELAGADAHNTYLVIASETGIPALMIFLLILLMLIKNSWWLLIRTKDRYFKAFALGMLGGICGLLLANMFGSRLNAEEVSSYFWLLSGLIMRAVIMRKQGEVT